MTLIGHTAASLSTADQPFSFGTKADTLERLSGRLTVALLCAQDIVGIDEWRTARPSVIERLTRRFSSSSLAIRSSCVGEDGAEDSHAGAYLSLTHIEPNETSIAQAIDQVVASYGDAEGAHQVLVQPMVTDVALSGVVLTRELDSGGPYYVINYDDISGRTDTVTSGAESKTVLVHRANPEALHSPRMRRLIAAVREIEQVTGSEELDIEFCVTGTIDVYVLQVRPLAARHQWQAVSDGLIDEAILTVRQEVALLQNPRQGIAGSTTVLGEMPDWNPAEMIGNTPRQLGMSLYSHLITDRIWADARAAMGYRHVKHPLMVSLAGRPYIDVRLSLNSFLPADLDAGIAERLVNAELAYLSAFPDLHDKIEFEVALTCRDPSFATRVDALKTVDLPDADIAAIDAAYTNLTARCLHEGAAGIESLLERPRNLLVDALPKASDDPLHDIRALLSKTARDGTLPFSILARHAFIGTAILRGLVMRDAFPQEEADRFVRSIHTVAAEVVEAIGAVAEGTLSEAQFFRRFGHLRPGTYDIESWRYDERPDLCLGYAKREVLPAEPFSLTGASRRMIAKLMTEEGLSIEPDALFAYIAAAIAAREEAKFSFTRGISDALLALTHWGETVGLSRKELSYLNIETLLDSPTDIAKLRTLISQAEQSHVLTRALRFPHLIVEPDDLDVVRPLRGHPTFITAKRVTSPTIHLAVDDARSIDGRIVLIESADPGYDWIFSHSITGLITKYGGTNSHMAIRCAEFGLPAAIGCGERLFVEMLHAQVIDLDCANRRLFGR